MPEIRHVSDEQGIAPEDRELFNTFESPSERRNLADLITAKLAAHERRVQFKDAKELSEPRPPSLPPKVVEVYKKFYRFEDRD